MKRFSLTTFGMFFLFSAIVSCSNDKKEEYNFFSELEIGEFNEESKYFIQSSSDSLLWKEIIAKSEELNAVEPLVIIPSPKIEAMLKKELQIKGEKIEEKYLPRTNNLIAQLGCKNGKPIIYYFSNAKKDLVCFTFIRFHEFAHVALKHSSCPDNVQRRRRYEYEADSMAIAMLLEYEDGIRVIDRVAGFFYAVNYPGGMQAPGSKERADKFYSATKLQAKVQE